MSIEELPEGLFLATSDELQGLVAQGRTVAETLEIARNDNSLPDASISWHSLTSPRIRPPFPTPEHYPLKWPQAMQHAANHRPKNRPDKTKGNDILDAPKRRSVFASA